MNLKSHHLWIAGMVLILSLSKCYYDNEEDLYPVVECNTTNMSYANNVNPIITNNCLSCHNAQFPQGGVVLEGYSNLHNFVINGKLKGSIQHDSGFSPMPQGAAKLSSCFIQQINAWIDQGAQNN
ncbi:MAG TPA: hypothetical protein P5275_03300 [Saprospiraceae bacterium]|nr:hypothetical protein [Saprospiraceae bacterium]MCB9269172.1 hypothetical protein [Lewinellaceae bacterium]HPG05403.1 hypothetical protein [Saprospiraceae bacterium]HPQ99943.1 hypothetical protein [Saprospiraceae bacterium]HQU54854.1 hypothetical protein [Saprospiraceae bacterium]